MTSLHRQRRLGASGIVVVLIAALLSTAAPPAQAAVLQVSANRIGAGTVTDPIPDGCRLDDCSLREAVIAANGTPDPDVITFAEAGVVTLTIGDSDDERALSNSGPGTFGQATQDLDSLEPLTIEGLGQDQTVIRSAFRHGDGGVAIARETRILDSRARLTMSDLTLEDAFSLAEGGLIRATDDTTLVRMTFQRGLAQGGGGAIALTDSTLTIESSTFQSNASQGDGGAVWADDYDSVDVLSSVFEDNAAQSASGGAIHGRGEDRDAPLEVQESSFVNNQTPPGTDDTDRNGGAISLVRGRLFIDESAFRGNGAQGPTARVTGTRQGGAIYTTEDTEEVGIFDSVFVDNAAETVGGAMVLGMAFGEIRRSLIAESVSGQSGAIRVNADTVLEVANSTITGSTARQTAALDIHPQSATTLSFSTITDSTITEDDRFQGNPPSAIIGGGEQTLTMLATIVSDTTGAPNCAGGGIVSLGSNLSDDTSCALPQPSDQIEVDPQIGSLSDNGGRAVGASQASEVNLTHAPAAAGPAVDTVDFPACGEFPFDLDQRGVDRPQGSACDRGAHEFGDVSPVPSPTASPTPTPDPTTSPDPTGSPEPEPTLPPSVDARCDLRGSGGRAIPDGVTRLEGPTRIQTAVAASVAVCGDGTAPAVVLTRADQFPDAQAGTPLAVALGAPLLLTQPDVLHADTEAEIRRVLAPGGVVHLLGGELALSSTVADQLTDAGFQTVRYAGENRFQTAVQIAVVGLRNPDTVLLADGGDFAASIVAGTAATAINDGDVSEGSPDRPGPEVAAVLLTSGNAMAPETQVYLDQRDGEAVAIGTAAAAAAPALPAIAGPTAIETAVAVAEQFFAQPSIVGMARVDDFADGLAGGAVIGRSGIGPGPMLLVPTDQMPNVVAEWLTRHADSLRAALIFGGSAAIGTAVEAAIPLD